MSQHPHTISATEFKANCLKLIDKVQADGLELIITKHGKPIARLVPYEAVRPVAGFLAGTGFVTGDIMSPSGDIWDAEHE